MPRKAWENRASAKRAKLRDTIPEAWRITDIDNIAPQIVRNVIEIPQGHLTDDECLITGSSVAAILENLATGVWSSVEVTSAFCHRAAIAHQLVNCLSEILFDSALGLARQLDDMRISTGKLKGPLHGLPISFMDRYRIAGSETACGYIAWLGKYETQESESLMVRLMRDLGAIPFCKTNIPMSMMIGETVNNVIGSTSNPFVSHLTCGGAAGGEGALLALEGSCAGWATEIAGSARIPAAFGNLFALKPSSGRMPVRGIASTAPSTPLCDATVAPICRDMSSLKTICKAVLGNLPVKQDTSLLNLPWRESKYAETTTHRLSRKKPVFGVLFCDGHVQPHPPVTRALETTVAALRRSGYQVVSWSPPPHEPAVRILFQILGADGLAGVRQTLDQSGEPPVSQLREWYHQTEPGAMVVSDFWSLCERRTGYQTKYQDYWNTTEVDGVIMPVAPSACAEYSQSTYFGYTAIANVLDYSAGAFPVGFADEHIDIKSDAEQALSTEDEEIARKYDPKTYHGAPVGLQVMCRRLEEEKVIALMEVIQSALEMHGGV